LDLLDTAVKTPPAFMFHDLVGFPINVIFIEFMQNQNGRSFFSNPNVNQALKTIMADYNLMIQSPKSLKYMNTEFPKGWFSPEAIQ
jgi:phosphatidylserine decarboxylase